MKYYENIMQNNNREVQFNNLKKVHRRYNTAPKSSKWQTNH